MKLENFKRIRLKKWMKAKFSKEIKREQHVRREKIKSVGNSRRFEINKDIFLFFGLFAL